jgi:hypothetical protein
MCDKLYARKIRIRIQIWKKFVDPNPNPNKIIRIRNTDWKYASLGSDPELLHFQNVDFQSSKTWRILRVRTLDYCWLPVLQAVLRIQTIFDRIRIRLSKTSGSWPK